MIWEDSIIRIKRDGCGWGFSGQELGWINKTPLLEYDISLARLLNNSSNTIPPPPPHFLENSVDALASPLHWIYIEREKVEHPILQLLT